MVRNQSKLQEENSFEHSEILNDYLRLHLNPIKHSKTINDTHLQQANFQVIECAKLSIFY